MKITSFTEQSPIFSIYSSYHALGEFYSRNLRALNVNFVQALIVLTLYFEGKSRITPKALVTHLGISKSSISQALSVLEDLGWVKRTMDEADARSLFILLTPEGKRHASGLIKVFDGLEREFEKRLGKLKVKALCEALREMTSTLKEAGQR